MEDAKTANQTDNEAREEHAMDLVNDLQFEMINNVVRGVLWLFPTAVSDCGAEF